MVPAESAFQSTVNTFLPGAPLTPGTPVSIPIISDCPPAVLRQISTCLRLYPDDGIAQESRVDGRGVQSHGELNGVARDESSQRHPGIAGGTSVNDAWTYRRALASPLKRIASPGLVAPNVQLNFVVASPSRHEVLVKVPLPSIVRPRVVGTWSST